MYNGVNAVMHFINDNTVGFFVTYDGRFMCKLYFLIT